MTGTNTGPGGLLDRPGRKLDLGSGMPAKDPTKGWVFLDGYVDHPDVVKHDMISFPWPFPDDHFDLVHASHVLEHTPVLFQEWNGTQRDVLFALVEEVHRVLKPGGRFHVRVPLGGTDVAHDHPQHYRHWQPHWFRFFDRESGEAAAYHDANFSLETLRFNRMGYRWRHFMPLGPSRLGLTEHLVTRFPRALGPLLKPRHELEAVLVARK